MIAFLYIFLFFHSFPKLINSYNWKFTKIENCTSSGLFYTVERCEILDNRLFYVVNQVKPIKKALAQYQLEIYNKGRDGLKIIKLPVFDWCKISSPRRVHPIMSKVMDIVFKGKEGTLSCNKLGPQKMENISLNYPALHLLPTGNVKVSSRTYNDEDKNMKSLTVLIDIDND